MKILLLAVIVLFVSLQVSHAGSADPSEQAKVEDIYAGACFALPGNTKCDIIIVQNWNKKYFLGDSWGTPFALYSNWNDEKGGTAEQVTSYLRQQGYRHIGKVELKPMDKSQQVISLPIKEEVRLQNQILLLEERIRRIEDKLVIMGGTIMY